MSSPRWSSPLQSRRRAGGGDGPAPARARGGGARAFTSSGGVRAAATLSAAELPRSARRGGFTFGSLGRGCLINSLPTCWTIAAREIAQMRLSMIAIALNRGSAGS
jgi:hypothetical protein